MTSKVLSISFLLFCATILTSCNKDKESPTVIISNPIEHTHFDGGETIDITAVFSDDQDLASYEFYIGDAGLAPSTELVWGSTGTISGKGFTLNASTQLPTGLDDEYYIVCKVVDSEGKTTTESIEIHVEP